MKRILWILVLAMILPWLPLGAGAAELEIAGKSAVLMDVATGTVLAEQNPHERLSPASVTKIMTMLLIMEAVDSGKIAITDLVTASPCHLPLHKGGFGCPAPITPLNNNLMISINS